MSYTTRSAKALAVAVLAAGSLVAGGCTSPATRGDAKLASFFDAPEWMKKAPWSKKEDEPPVPYPGPVKMATTWSPDVLVQTGKTPTRGFGGRLFFFDEKTKAVPVEGTLTIHGFEMGTDGNDAQVKPFKFTPEQFTKHFSQSDFGASYNIWIPWDAAGGEEKRVSLVPTFQTTAGKIVQGSPTTVILPGRKAERAMEVANNYLSPQYRGHKNAITQHATRPSGLVTTTIRRHTTSPDGTNTLPSGSLQDRVNAMAASYRNATNDGATPFIDVPSTTPPVVAQTPSRTPAGVMPASAVMSDRESNSVRSAGAAVTAPRRIQSPVSSTR
ncbi:hypothetical protein Mal15_12660 [Stieleria maiorica]|uniref:Uncharacterized protein n=1 Tax=Stieleria maiorica TaxID=2795974 RepID=A0A5B9M7Q1_9BACT|nr:hypothetical protein [Stieleria maiorica]QEF97228.1 hypothetical protein Mal15_12660 [Stieleria maiorica]